MALSGQPAQNHGGGTFRQEPRWKEFMLAEPDEPPRELHEDEGDRLTKRYARITQPCSHMPKPQEYAKPRSRS
jgi:hypothetical protein